jgi:hypothetical protein
MRQRHPCLQVTLLTHALPLMWVYQYLGTHSRPSMALLKGVYARPPLVPRPFKAGTVLPLGERTGGEDTATPTAIASAG